MPARELAAGWHLPEYPAPPGETNSPFGADALEGAVDARESRVEFTTDGRYSADDCH